MNKYIIVKYSELTLKGRNRKSFTSILKQNIKHKLDAFVIDAKIQAAYDKMIILPKNKEEISKILIALKDVVGISWFAVVYIVKTSEINLISAIDNLLHDQAAKTFRVSAKVFDKSLWSSSEELTSIIAGHVLNTFNLKVNLKNFDLEINVKVNNDDTMHIYGKKYTGHLGLPAGVNGKGLTLISGGIDSPVASYMAITRGLNMNFVIFLTPNNMTGETENKIELITNRINDFNGVNGKLFIVNFQKVQQEISSLKEEQYRTILLRRYFLKTAEAISKIYGYKLLITGDSLGQVASQTVEAMTVINSGTEMLIIRPLVGMSKNEIIGKATSIGTLEFSNLPGSDTCSVFAPNSPELYPKLKDIKELEDQLLFIDEIIKDTVANNMEIIKLAKK